VYNGFPLNKAFPLVSLFCGVSFFFPLDLDFHYALGVIVLVMFPHLRRGRSGPLTSLYPGEERLSEGISLILTKAEADQVSFRS